MTLIRRPLFGLLLVAGLLTTVVPAAAGHTERTPSLKYLAHELADAARYVHKTAEHSRHHYTYREKRALSTLHELDRAAHHFRKQVRRHSPDPYHTGSDFEALRRIYFDAARDMRALHAYGTVTQEFRRVTDLVFQLERGFYYRGVNHRHDDHQDHDGLAYRTRPWAYFRFHWRY